MIYESQVGRIKKEISSSTIIVHHAIYHRHSGLTYSNNIQGYT